MSVLEIVGLGAVYVGFVCFVGIALMFIVERVYRGGGLGAVAIMLWVVGAWLAISTVAGIFGLGFIVGGRP